MSKDEREFLDALRARSIEAAAEILAGVQRLKSMYDEITDDGSGNPLPRPRLGDQFYQLAKFELEHASTLIRLGNSQAEMVFEHLRQLARRSQKSSSPVLTLEPASPDATLATGRFEIRNPFEASADLRFVFGEVKTGAGETLGPEAMTRLGLRAAAGKGGGVVRAHDTISIEVVAARPDETLFGDLRVLLSADIEKQVAHRVVKIRAEARTR